MDKEPHVVIEENMVDSDEFWGSKQRIVEIIGEGGGNGFSIKNANLPLDWENNLDNIQQINPDVYADNIQYRCNVHGYNLKQISFDHNNIMTGFAVINKRDNSENSMKLGGNFIETEKAEYTTKRLTKIGAAVLMQTIMSDYLSIGWGEENIKYGRIEYHGEAMNGYDPYLLEIPKNVDIDKRITNEYYQDRFIAKANNIAGRFGLNLENIKFNENGILCFVEVSGQNGCYYNIDMMSGEIISHQYHCHNVDRPDQAAALHGIVASYINDLIEMNEK